MLTGSEFELLESPLKALVVMLNLAVVVDGVGDYPLVSLVCLVAAIASASAMSGYVRSRRMGAETTQRRWERRCVMALT